MFTDQEKGRIRHFLGYPSWSAMAASIQLGFPSGSQPLFLVEQAFIRLLPDGEAAVRRDLCNCEAVEEQLAGARSRLKVMNAGEVKMNPQERTALREELAFWTKRLADDLGVVQNPYSTMAYEGMGGVNAPVE
jgi:hypothetical protein